MTKTSSPFCSSKALTALSQVLLAPGPAEVQISPTPAELHLGITEINREQFDEMLALAQSHHVVMRGLDVFLQIMRHAGDDCRAEWAATALAAEAARIENAISFLQRICGAFRAEGYDVTVIKSLDHWPDLGSDLDLYTNAASDDVTTLMKRRFDAQIAPRSWGDRLAGKWNFVIAGLPEAVEIHVGRLGQTGEQARIASRVVKGSQRAVIGKHTFQVPSTSDRLMI